MRRASLVLALSAAFVGVAQAQTPNGVSCDLPANSFGGTGIPTTNAFCATTVVNGVSLALSSTQRYTSPTVTTDGLGTYTALAGESTGAPANPGNSGFATWDIDFAIGGTADQRGASFFEVLIDLDPAVGVFTPIVDDVPNVNEGFFDATNSGYLNLLVSPGLFNPFLTGQYTIELEQFTRATGPNGEPEAGRLQNSVEINVNVTATPEPASLALMATGLLGVGGFVRRRNRRNAA